MKDENTVWRLQRDDFKMVINDRLPELSEDEVEKLIDEAATRFHIENWTEQVGAYIDSVTDGEI